MVLTCVVSMRCQCRSGTWYVRLAGGVDNSRRAKVRTRMRASSPTKRNDPTSATYSILWQVAVSDVGLARWCGAQRTGAVVRETGQALRRWTLGYNTICAFAKKVLTPLPAAM